MAKVSIPEMEATGHTPESTFAQIMLLAESATKSLSDGHRKNDLTDAIGTLLYMGQNFLKQAQSLQTLAEQGQDAVSCYGLIRMQADNLCVMYRIYANNDEVETTFRYLLYYLDGNRKRKEALSFDYQYDGYCSKEEYDSINTQVNSARANAESIIEICLRLLNNHPYKALNPSLFQKIVDNSNWKYESFDATLTKPKTQNWKDLYTLIDNRPNIQSFYSYTSQYVHGLSNSLLLGESTDDFYSIKCFGISLLGKYWELLNLLFGEQIVVNAAAPTVMAFIKKCMDEYLSGQKSKE
ncbi:MAG: DUF5677 domain-containing protein [Paraprevotella sp.]|nr:DUF5677 domain-containing protein [Paraprevotella sp.]